jgi:hypothetical protein
MLSKKFQIEIIRAIFSSDDFFLIKKIAHSISQSDWFNAIRIFIRIPIDYTYWNVSRVVGER